VAYFPGPVDELFAVAADGVGVGDGHQAGPPSVVWYDPDGVEPFDVPDG
jgi:hypothetical protein